VASALSNEWGRDLLAALDRPVARVGEGQTLGNRLDFGGPSFGFFAAEEGQEGMRAFAEKRPPAWAVTPD